MPRLKKEKSPAQQPEIKRKRQKRKGVCIDIKVGTGETYRIVGELRQWACGPVVKDKTGKDVHKQEFFYSSLQGMLNGMAERKLRLSDASSFSELATELKRIREEFQGYYDMNVVK